ncbi:hypothetical protein Bfae_24210 [Brachybacterium faecium DSM 4810]|uniref:DUF4229 domain-containing protein n=1 Tax=Brachybacterium faecium (strain ATCC 43885 / DSM 4810 / JCM 11609 / LMG 19847 / NBRC 14762 / NCIMB 9860 / 6-10) TaxID=446465 RepID=C7MFJ5_BRAFD|nr:DUF4229 domain-containing protein [Brachybacterium faecium]ACU86212.1 hypothetical protein Bfae_24210 [Brachybacterium faecium DSM 4810]
MRHFLLYAVVRLGLWAVLWWVLTLFDVGVVLAGVLAALIAMLLSILFLDRLRGAAAMRWKAADERRARRREGEIDEDAEYEDSLLDEAEAEDGAVPGEDGAELTEDGEVLEEGGEAAQLPALDDEIAGEDDPVRGEDR